MGKTRVTDDPIESSYVQVHLFALALERAKSTKIEKIREAARGINFLKPPGGLVRIDPTNQHTWKVARVGQIQANGQFAIRWSSKEPIKPEPFSFNSRAKRMNIGGTQSFGPKSCSFGLAAALGPVILMGYLWNHSEEEKIEKDVTASSPSLQTKGAKQIGDHVANRKMQAETLAKSPFLRNETRRLMQLTPEEDEYFRAQFHLYKQLEVILVGQTWIKEIQIISSETGKILVGSEAGSIGHSFRGTAEELAEVRKGKTLVTSVLASEIDLPNENGEMETHLPIQVMTSPMVGEGEMQGVLMLRADALELDRHLLKGSGFYENLGIESIDVYLVDSNGTFLTQSAFEQELLPKARRSRFDRLLSLPSKFRTGKTLPKPFSSAGI